MRSSELAEKLLRHRSHRTGRDRLTVGSKVLDDHRENRSQCHRHNLRRDANLLRRLLNQTGSTQSLRNLVGSRGSSLTRAPGANVRGHSVVLEGIENTLDAFRMLGQGLDKASSHLGL